MVRYVSVAIVVLGVLALSIFGGYGYRNAQCERDTEIALRETSDALAVLARQYATADTRYREEKRKRLSKDSADRQVAADALQNTATNSCGWTSDERGILHRSYCAAFPTAPTCPVP